eukprot:gene3518-4422_t
MAVPTFPIPWARSPQVASPMTLNCALALLLLLKSHLGTSAVTVQNPAASDTVGDALAAPPGVAEPPSITTDGKEPLNKTITPPAELPIVEARFYAVHQKAARAYFQMMGNWSRGEGLLPPGEADTEGGICALAEGCVRQSILQAFLAQKWIPGRALVAEDISLTQEARDAIKFGQFYEPISARRDPRGRQAQESLMADFVHYLLTRPREAVPPEVRALILPPGKSDE